MEQNHMLNSDFLAKLDAMLDDAEQKQSITKSAGYDSKQNTVKGSIGKGNEMSPQHVVAARDPSSMTGSVGNKVSSVPTLNCSTNVDSADRVPNAIEKASIDSDAKRNKKVETIRTSIPVGVEPVGVVYSGVNQNHISLPTKQKDNFCVEDGSINSAGTKSQAADISRIPHAPPIQPSGPIQDHMFLKSTKTITKVTEDYGDGKISVKTTTLHQKRDGTQIKRIEEETNLDESINMNNNMVRLTTVGEGCCIIS